jgi:hypothetical protein
MKRDQFSSFRDCVLLAAVDATLRERLETMTTEEIQNGKLADLGTVEQMQTLLGNMLTMMK